MTIADDPLCVALHRKTCTRWVNMLAETVQNAVCMLALSAVCCSQLSSRVPSPLSITQPTVPVFNTNSYTPYFLFLLDVVKDSRPVTITHVRQLADSRRGSNTTFTSGRPLPYACIDAAAVAIAVPFAQAFERLALPTSAINLAGCRGSAILRRDHRLSEALPGVLPNPQHAARAIAVRR